MPRPGSASRRHGKVGRPALAPEVKRGGAGGRQLGVRLNAAEWAEVERRAQVAGMPPTAYARRLVVEGRPPTLPPAVPAVNREAWVELARLAGNVNQLAARVNSLTAFGPGGPGRGVGLLDADWALLDRVGAEVRALRLSLLGQAPWERPV